MGCTCLHGLHLFIFRVLHCVAVYIGCSCSYGCRCLYGVSMPTWRSDLYGAHLFILASLVMLGVVVNAGRSCLYGRICLYGVLYCICGVVF